MDVNNIFRYVFEQEASCLFEKGLKECPVYVLVYPKTVAMDTDNCATAVVI